jgi:hypothetical protein
MAEIVGYQPKHVGGVKTLQYLFNENKYNFYADTPFFSISFLEQINFLDFKLIYVDKDPHAIYRSFKKVGLERNLKLLKDFHLAERWNTSNMIDYLYLLELVKNVEYKEEDFCECIATHKERIKRFADKHKKPLLFYSFEQGWAPFCNYLNVNVPDAPLPHLNINTMFDKI